jgi:hypothetical protein
MLSGVDDGCPTQLVMSFITEGRIGRQCIQAWITLRFRKE